jgi:hypothetical protein
MYLIHDVDEIKVFHNSYKIVISPYSNTIFNIELNKRKLIVYDYPEFKIIYKYDSLQYIDAIYCPDGNLVIYGASIIVQNDLGWCFNTLIKDANVILLSVSGKHICYYDDTNYINIININGRKIYKSEEILDVISLNINDNYMAYCIKNYIMVHKMKGSKWLVHKKISNIYSPSLLLYNDTLLISHSGSFVSITMNDKVNNTYIRKIETSGKYSMCVSNRGQLILSSPYAYHKSGAVSIYIFIDNKWRLKKSNYLCGSNKNELYGKFISICNNGTLFTVSNNIGESKLYCIS